MVNAFRLGFQNHPRLLLQSPFQQLFPIPHRFTLKRSSSFLQISNCNTKLLSPSTVASKSVVRALRTEAEDATHQLSKMVKAIRVYEHGGPEVLKWEDVEIGEPNEGEVRVKNKAIGLNFIDVYFRKGFYQPTTMPFTPGLDLSGKNSNGIRYLLCSNANLWTRKRLLMLWS